MVFVKLLWVEIIHPPGVQMRTVVKKIEEDTKGEIAPGRMILSKEQVLQLTSGTEGIIIWARRGL